MAEAIERLESDVEELTELVQRAQRGDLEAFGMVVARFQNMAYAQAYSMLRDRHLAEDAAQEAFIDAYVSLPRLREAVAFPAWFRRIIFKHVDRILRSRPVLLVPIDTVPDLVAFTPDPASIAEMHETNGTVHDAIATLPAHQRSAVVLHYLSDASYKDIAAILDVPVSTVKKRLHDARKRLKQRMINMADELESQRPSDNDRFANRVRFLLAIRAGEVAAIRRLLDHDPSLIEAQEEWSDHEALHYDPMTRGFTGLHRAAWQGNAPVVELLLTKGASTNATRQGSTTPLHLAAQMGHRQVVELLLAHRADPNARMANGLTPLHWAVMRGHATIVDVLLARGAAPDIRGKGDRTPLDWAKLKGYDRIAELLQAHGAQK